MRFSLRTLIIVMLVGGPVCAWGLERWQKHREAERQRQLMPGFDPALDFKFDNSKFGSEDPTSGYGFQAPVVKPMSPYTLRDVLWLTLVVGMGVGWWLDHRAQRKLLREQS